MNGFATIGDARDRVLPFVHWYNQHHRHIGIRYVTPEHRHDGADHKILATHDRIYRQMRHAHPARWPGKTRNWQSIGAVWLNPEADLDAV